MNMLFLEGICLTSFALGAYIHASFDRGKQREENIVAGGSEEYKHVKNRSEISDEERINKSHLNRVG